jgi:hypothetical protein
MKKNATIEMNKIKLRNYSAMAGAVLASGAVNAQITYVDVNPDATVGTANSPYNLDFNNDANPDVIFSVQAGSGAGSASYMGIPFTYTYEGVFANVQAGANAAVLGTITGSSSTFAPAALNDGDAIGAAGQFGSGGGLAYAGVLNVPAFSILDYPVEGGAFLGQNDKFLGARFTNSGSIHYGWVRLSVAADATTITIKDYAYNSVAATAINAGQTLGLEDVAVNQKVTIKTQLDQAFINVTPDLIGGEIAMVDLSGKEIMTVAITDILTTVAFEGIDTGIYMLTARFEAGSISKKVYVK